MSLLIIPSIISISITFPLHPSLYYPSVGDISPTIPPCIIFILIFFLSYSPLYYLSFLISLLLFSLPLLFALFNPLKIFPPSPTFPITLPYSLPLLSLSLSSLSLIIPLLFLLPSSPLLSFSALLTSDNVTL